MIPGSFNGCAGARSRLPYDSMKARGQVSDSRRYIYLSAAVAFLFFLVFSTPHRVHHFFEGFPAQSDGHGAQAKAHGHAGGEHHSHNKQHGQKPSSQNDCSVLSVAKNAHASVVHSFDFAVFKTIAARNQDPTYQTASSFNPSPFSQRAPPSI
jgi:hypothetical protein